MQVSRRNILKATPLAVMAVALSGCAFLKGHTGQQNVAQISADVSNIANALKAAVPQILALKGLNPTTLANIESSVADLGVVAGNLASAAAASAAQVAQSTLAQVETDVSSVVNSLVGISLPDALAKVVQAVSVLLPTILSVAGFLTVQPKAGPMSPDQARAYLRLYAGKR